MSLYEHLMRINGDINPPGKPTAEQPAAFKSNPKQFYQFQVAGVYLRSGRWGKDDCSGTELL